MIFTELDLEGAFLVDLEPIEDERGFFARMFDRTEFETRGLELDVRQCSVSFNHRRFTMRGLHYQVAPHKEAKLVRCLSGSVFDVIVDLRQGSPTYRRWTGVELSSSNRSCLYVPEDFAHGFQTLEDGSEVLYMISTEYEPAAARGIRWNDPALDIAWPEAPSVISDRDGAYPDVR